jgi:pimeloyl-ACP methyl ester carboxylesterase
MNLLISIIALSLITIPGGPSNQKNSQPIPIDRLVDIGGHKLHLVCVGSGSPTIILEAGAGDTSNVWSQVQQGMPRTIETCAYDRAGSGSSEKGPTPRTMKQEIYELHALLKAADIPGPYVLVGHSYGGLLVRLYAEAYPAEVAGVVLVDPTHENTRLSVQRRGDPEARWVRIREGAKGVDVPAPKLGVAAQSTGDGATYWPEELQQMHVQRTSNPTTLGDRPLIVLAGTKPMPPQGGASVALWLDLMKEKAAEKEDLARLSRNSRLVKDSSSGHHIQTDNPSLVITAIKQVFDAAKRGTKLQ